jgi:SAM-dependent methyltransferase
VAHPTKSDVEPTPLTSWREQIVEFHEGLVRERGEGWGAFWGSPASQRDRYAIFFRELPLSDRAVLEVGCGFGDFLHVAREQGAMPRRYLGVDLSATIIAAARRSHPQADFAILDILTAEPPFQPDFVIASGIMAVDVPDYESYVLAILRRFYALSRCGFALNFLSTCSEKPDGRSRYVDPAWLLSLFQRSIDWRCRLLHDYRSNDFTLVYQRPPTR